MAKKNKVLLQPNIQIRLGDWSELHVQACAIRFEVFVQEQHVPIAEELDAMDAQSLHALAFNDSGETIATGRLLPDGHIGRMAVKLSERKKGVGTAVLCALVNSAQAKGMLEVVLSAQLHAKDFYVKQGFTEYGETFMDANIEHICMKKTLNAPIIT